MVSNKTVLIIEKSNKLSLRLSEMITKLDYSYDLVNSGDKCLSFLQNKYYHFILLNLHIDGEIQGTYILRWLERKRYFTNTIVYSYYPSSSTWIKSIKEKWRFEYLENPFTFSKLKNKFIKIKQELEKTKNKKKEKNNKKQKNNSLKSKYRSLSLPDLYKPIPTDSMKWSETILIDLSEKLKDSSNNSLFSISSNQNKLPKI